MPTLYDTINLARRSAQPLSSFPPLSPEEERSALSILGTGAWNGVQYVAGSLDKLRRPVASLLGLITGNDEANARELLSWIPFSDTLGLTDEQDALYGRDLLEGWGMAPENQQGFASPEDAAWDIAGFGLDLLTDPLSFVNSPGSALTKAGVVTKKAGFLDDALLAARQAAPNAAEAAKIGKYTARARQTAGDILNATTDPKLYAARREALRTAAEAEGITGRAFDELLGAPLAGLAEVQPFPFAPASMRKVVGSPELTQTVARYLDNPMDAVGKLPLVGRPLAATGRAIAKAAQPLNAALGAAFDATRRDVTDPALVPYTQQLTRQRDELAGLESRLPQELITLAGNEGIETNRLWDILSGVKKPASAIEQEIVQKYRAASDDMLQAQQAAGVKQGKYFSHAGNEYATRARAVLPGEGATAEYVANTANQYAKGRREWTNGWAGETVQLNKIADEARQLLADGKPKDEVLGELSARYQQDWNGWDASGKLPVPEAMPADLKKLIAKEKSKLRSRTASVNKKIENAASDEIAESLQEQLDQFSDATQARIEELQGQMFASKMLERRAFGPQGLLDKKLRKKQAMRNPENVIAELRGEAGLTGALRRAISASSKLPQGTALFPNNPLQDMQRYVRNTAENRVAAETVTEAVGDMIRGMIPGQVDEGGVTVREALKRLRLNPKQVLENLQQNLGSGFEDIAKIKLDTKAVEQLSQMYRGFVSPKSLKPIAKLVDSATNLFKMGVLSFPARHVRDMVSSVYHGLVNGGTTLKRYQSTLKLLKGEADETLTEIPLVRQLLESRGLENTAENATVVARELLAANGVLGKHQGAVTGAATGAVGFDSAVTSTADLLKERLGGHGPQSAWDLVKPEKEMFSSWENAKPWNVRGVQEGMAADAAVRQESRFGPALLSEKWGENVESWVRASTFLDQLAKGVDPSQAKRVVDEVYVNYHPSSYTPFENQVMMRAMPFYRYSRRIIPTLVDRLMQKPGGVLATTLEAAAQSQGEETFTPDYLSGSLAIPVPGGEDGNTRYLTSLGLPFETLNLFEFGDRGFTKTGLNFLGNLNPLIKAPLEQATGRQFYSDRDIRDVDGRMGSLLENLGLITDASQVPQPLEQFLSNSPASRLLGTASTLTDPRKGWAARTVNTLTGFRLADVDEVATKEREVRTRLAETLRGEPGVGFFETSYVRNPDALSDEAEMLIRLQRTIQAERRAREAERARAE